MAAGDGRGWDGTWNMVRLRETHPRQLPLHRAACPPVAAGATMKVRFDLTWTERIKLPKEFVRVAEKNIFLIVNYGLIY